jgi:hypothetical protein
MVFLTAGFARETAEKRLVLKSLQGQTKAEEVGDRGSLDRAVLQEKLAQNSRTEGAPLGHGHPLKKSTVAYSVLSYSTTSTAILVHE